MNANHTSLASEYRKYRTAVESAWLTYGATGDFWAYAAFAAGAWEAYQAAVRGLIG